MVKSLWEIWKRVVKGESRSRTKIRDPIEDTKNSGGACEKLWWLDGEIPQICLNTYTPGDRAFGRVRYFLEIQLL